jgi:hypothetical protein
MNKMTDVLQAVQNDTLDVAIWEVLTILVVATICMLWRGSKMGLLITYVFTLHIAFTFFKLHFSTASLLILGIFAAAILLIGLYEALTER